MRTTLLTTAALFGLACSLPAFAQSAAPAGVTDQAPPAATAPDATPGTTSTGDTAAPTNAPKPPRRHMTHRSAVTGDNWAHQPGTGESGPASTKASNIDSADSRSEIAPHFPEPAQGQNATPKTYLNDAQTALMHHRTGLAQQALEMAETRLLDRSTAPDAASQPDQAPAIHQVTLARDDLAHGDIHGAEAAIRAVLATDTVQMPAGKAESEPSMGQPAANSGMPNGAMPSSGALNAGTAPTNTAPTNTGGAIAH